jgi:hypothetical protein
MGVRKQLALVALTVGAAAGISDMGGDPITDIGGDPITSDEHGVATRFYLSTRSETSLIKQPLGAKERYPLGIEVKVLGGPALAAGEVKRGDWMTMIKLLVNGVTLLTASLLPVAGLLREALPAGLTSLNLTIAPEQKLVQEVGSFDLWAKATPAMPVNVAVSQVANKKIGTGHVETATIKVGADFELSLWTAKASKFASELDQITNAHLDFKVLKYDRKFATGPLPEMWGLRPMSAITKTMLSPHAMD